MPYVGWESNIALAKVRGHLAIGYPRRPDGKAFQISRGGKMANNTKLANSVKQTRCLLVIVFLFPWSPQEYCFGWRQLQGRPSRRQNNKALPVNTHGSSALGMKELPHCLKQAGVSEAWLFSLLGSAWYRRDLVLIMDSKAFSRPCVNNSLMLQSTWTPNRF